MGNAIGSLIRLRKDTSQEDEDSILLSEEHGLILTCCWVSVKVSIFQLSPIEDAPEGPMEYFLCHSIRPIFHLKTASFYIRLLSPQGILRK